jgi:adhesin HecA-like repeat protein
MRRTPRRFLSSLARLVGPPIMMFAPMVAAHAHGDIAVPASATTTADPTGMTITVTNCNDRGPGSLRVAVARALSGDTIDMTGLACRRINLTSGPIRIPQGDLTLVGGGGMTVDANGLSSVFRHSGTGWLRIRGMTIARGVQTAYAGIDMRGGCIDSEGNVELRNALVHWCLVQHNSNFGSDSLGGGIYANGAVTLTDSQVLNNTAIAGGGIFAGGHLTTYRSHICGNHGGGVQARSLHASYTTFSDNKGAPAIDASYVGSNNYAVIANSTIFGNRSPSSTLILGSRSYGSMMQIINSTISGNRARYTTVLLNGAKSIVNSTIVFNQNSDNCDSQGTVHMWPRGGPLHIESSIVANNTCAGSPHRDISGSVGIASVEGANNLVTSSNLPLPPDTISVDPRLAPLVNNGGRTRTHALFDDSPAIDMGNNAAGLAYDQRGPGFPRVKGPRADIGAYER